MIKRSIGFALNLALYTPVFAQAPTERFVPLQITEPRNAAVGYALTQAQFANTLLGACSKLDEARGAQARTTWSNWQDRNWAHVEAARGWLQYVRSMATARQGEAAGAAIQSHVVSVVATNARAALLDVLPDGQPQAPQCDKWFALLSHPKVDLYASNEFGRDLDDILVFHREVLKRAPQR